MAITATDRGTGSHGTTVTSFNVAGALSATLTAGNTAVLIISMDNANAAGANVAATSYTDSAGNIWLVNIDQTQAATANANNELVLLTSNLTANLTSGGTLTITVTNSTIAKCWAFVELAPSAGNTVLLNFAAIDATTTATAAPSKAINSTVTGGVHVGFGGAERDDTWVGQASPWSTAQHTGVGSGTAGQSVITQTVTNVAAGGTSPVTGGPYAPTLTSSDVRMGYAYFTEADAKARTASYFLSAQAGVAATFSRPLAIGSIGVFMLTGDNTNTAGAAGNFPSTLTDSKSQTWTRRQNAVINPVGAINSGTELGIYTCVLTSALVPGDTLTGNYVTANITFKMWGVWEFAPTGAGVMSYVTGGTGTSGTGSTSPTITTSSIASGDYVIGLCGAELAGDITADADTSNGSWVTQINVGSGTTSATSQTFASQWKKVTSAGAQTYNPTLSASVDNVTGWIEINDTSSPPAGLTAAQKAAFFQMF